MNYSLMTYLAPLEPQNVNKNSLRSKIFTVNWFRTLRTIWLIPLSTSRALVRNKIFTNSSYGTCECFSTWKKHVSVCQWRLGGIVVCVSKHNYFCNDIAVWSLTIAWVWRKNTRIFIIHYSLTLHYRLRMYKLEGYNPWSLLLSWVLSSCLSLRVT